MPRIFFFLGGGGVLRSFLWLGLGFRIEHEDGKEQRPGTGKWLNKGKRLWCSWHEPSTFLGHDVLLQTISLND